MQNLSSDTLLQILYSLTGVDLFNTCKTNRKIYSCCKENNDFFWKSKVLSDYDGKNIPDKPTDISWKRFYIDLGTTNTYIKQVKIYYRIFYVGSIWINYTNKIHEIISRANTVFYRKFCKAYFAEIKNRHGILLREVYLEDFSNENNYRDSHLLYDVDVEIHYR